MELPGVQDTPTVSFDDDSPTPEPNASPDEHQFLPGTTFGKRYRIVELLGRGGMGEVYRADDLHLGQPVALKFLPRHLTSDSTALARLRNEVRVARQISHAHVCRVHDISEAEGLYFLSMEYIDGEDLASVLRRLGRPSREKSIEIARQLCIGLAAAHENGVLHRDLKPANIMIDGRGNLRITDFGLAGFSHEPHRGGRAGTPGYMAPELFNGGGATTKTDIYALGAVLYELFTGRPAFEAETLSDVRRLHETVGATRPSAIVDDLEPIVEEIILRCLDKDPGRRPMTALAVASVLPGVDLVAAALAAGQTPSPELVAGAGGRGVLRPVTAAAGLFAVVAGLAVIAGVNRIVTLHGLAPPSKPPVVLADRGREILDRLGYPEPPADTAFGFSVYEGYLDHVTETDADPNRWAGLRDRRPTPYWFWYRESPRSLTPLNAQARVHFGDPPLAVPGMANLKLDSNGRLGVLHVVPPRIDDTTQPVGVVDYSILFELAGLDPVEFVEAEPGWNPDVFADERVAWVGHYSDQPDQPIRVEAASLRGKLVHFNALESFELASGPGAQEIEPVLDHMGGWIQAVLVLAALGVPPLIARRNLRRGSGDRRGAVRLGLAVWALSLVGWVLSADHSVEVTAELLMGLTALGLCTLLGVWIGLVYLALEPSVRRMWPETMISWTRLLMGKIRDPRVGRDVLVGGMAGVLVIVIQRIEWLVPRWLGVAPGHPFGVSPDALLGGRKALARILDPGVLADPLIILLLLTLSLVLLRRHGAALAATLAVMALLDGHWSPRGPIDLLWATALVETVTLWAVLLFTLTRFGLLSLVAAFFFLGLLQRWPLTLDVSAWYGGTSLSVMLLMVAIAAAAMGISLGRDRFARA